MAAGGARGRPGQRKGDFLAGKYLLEDCLGIGGMGEVYRATNVSLGRKVAIKVLSREYVNIEDDVLRFLREARAAAAVRHPNVVDVLDVAREDDGTPFIVQELLDGEDLEQYLKHRGLRISPLEALEILIPVAEAVAAAHARDVVHRDLKPANIFLSREGSDGTKVTPKVLDFGACVFPTLGERSAKEVRLLIGTPHYMAPEQIVSRTDVDARSDVWALGVILYELLVGETPFEAANARTVLELVKTKDIPRLLEVATGVPIALSDLVAECTQRERSRRLQSVALLRERMTDIRAVLRAGGAREKIETQPEGDPAPDSPPSSIPPVLDPRAIAAPRLPSITLDAPFMEAALSEPPSDELPLDRDFDAPLDAPLQKITLDRDHEAGGADAVPASGPATDTRPRAGGFDSPIPDPPERITLNRIPRDEAISDRPRTLDTPIPPSMVRKIAPSDSKSPPPSSRRSSRIVRSVPWTPSAVARFAAAIVVPGLAAFAALMYVPRISVPLGRALRGDSTVASGVLTVVVLVLAVVLGARSIGAARERSTLVAAGGAVLFGMVMIVVTFSASEAAEIGVPPAAAALVPLVGPIAPLALATSAALHARARWLDPYEKRSAFLFAVLAGTMLCLMLALSPMGAVRVAGP